MARAEHVDSAALARLIGGWRAEDGPLPHALADALAELIAGNVLVEGAALPPQRALAAALGVSRGTVAEAYAELAARGRLTSRQGSGSRVRGDRITGGDHVVEGRLASFGRTRRLVELDLSSGALPALSLVRDAVSAVDLRELDVYLADDGYYAAGLPRLRAVVAEQYTLQGLPTGPDQILVTSGSQQAVWLCASSLVAPGDEVLVEEPGYRGAIEAFRTAGARLTGVPVREDGLDLDHLDRVAHRAALLYCQPAAHNPTGISLPAAERERLSRIVGRHGVLTIEDRSCADLVLDDRGMRPPLPDPANPGLVIRIGTASKLLWGGLRVGWIRAERPVITRLTQAKAALDLAAPVIDQMVTAELLAQADRARQERARRLRAHLAEAAAVLTELRPAWRWTPPSGGTALWIDTGTDAVALAERARGRGVLVTAGPAFSPSNAQRTRLRLPFWKPLEQFAHAVELLE
ncbi:transcriptional regulator, GntR family [Microbispora rosea]|uniref:Transcriptional regulator, GntR family n=1 Tax=Microbispora rosea TaxID=58117 RepID=A0A1N6X9M2_9ACTN|nr:PLP-dependent aminotransferase family protein [Microbispora rosea]GIH52857.1 putative GntR-family regulatory protein [Microbispora rosea subsp. rosea]SIQ99013.1 transcriptional regulator, GntR family [Microbispora rosea]